MIAALLLEDIAAMDLGDDASGEEDSDWICGWEVASADGLNCEYFAVNLSRGGDFEWIVIVLEYISEDI